ncbi:MAG: nucleoside-diphosphate-sugar epimerase [Myxococcota bacterium]|jgi:nucleoside-diphosphate-sugar epimerase
MSETVKVAILGGSGFMGYDLARTLHETDGFEPIVYSTSAKSLTNLARHDIDIRLVRYDDLKRTVLPKGVQYLVNYAHPFGNREALSIKSQISVLADFMLRNLERYSQLRAIQVSSMSVYEPFEDDHEFLESCELDPPRSDRYARSKCAFETLLEEQSELAGRLMLLRPTVVYGPFCRPWTDALLAGFEAGDVSYQDLDGRIQPIVVSDVSRFIMDRFADFAPGTFNLAGPETMKWHDFLNFFGNVVSRGRLVESDTPPQTTSAKRAQTVREVLGVAKGVLRDEKVKDLVRPVVSQLPAKLVETLKERLNSNLGSLARSVAEGGDPDGPFCEPFFAADRLVSTRATQQQFPDAEFTRLDASRDLLARYHSFRFRDEVLT